MNFLVTDFSEIPFYWEDIICMNVHTSAEIILLAKYVVGQSNKGAFGLKSATLNGVVIGTSPLFQCWHSFSSYNINFMMIELLKNLWQC